MISQDMPEPCHCGGWVHLLFSYTVRDFVLVCDSCGAREEIPFNDFPDEGYDD